MQYEINEDGVRGYNCGDDDDIVYVHSSACNITTPQRSPQPFYAYFTTFEKALAFIRQEQSDFLAECGEIPDTYVIQEGDETHRNFFTVFSATDFMAQAT